MSYDKFYEMHNQMAYRDNASSSLIGALATMGKPLNDALATGLLTLDTIHAPIRSACECFNHFVAASELDTSRCGSRVPGFGSAWYKGEPDPLVTEFVECLNEDVRNYVNEYTTYVQETWGKKVFPNAALATAAFAFQEDIAPHMAMSKVMIGRMDAWITIYMNNYKDKGFN